ncbi:Suppressor protein stp22 of temperature-sensitive alpha-factor receptor and arginine permease [Didymella glomerata]|uniref:Suppressor protein stp22 of temperature-sensitive alpha-factor receptor and arginine permease n=1 Tax=Didymella glomerata TaxID=749621 RepID=A0A9W9BWD0_9PLEO|nr:Suppressor protein stp22 of temperature-sensitive alpha-factor receptor and arginine permease [Didymella glomerata]
MAVPETTLNWLYSVLTSNYVDVNRTYHDATEALSYYSSLSVRTDVYTYENGSSNLLLNLSGTLPVTFRGATYGFPVAVWVPYAYPREPPIVYIKPDKDMLVRPGQYVSGDGRVYHPYLAQWAKYWDKSTLFDLLAVLRDVFAKEPPVRSRQPQPQYNAPAQQGPPPVPPPPAEYRRSVHATPVAHGSRQHIQSQNFQSGSYGPGSPVSPIAPQGQRHASGFARQAPPQQPSANGLAQQQYLGQQASPQSHGQPPPQEQQYRGPPQQYPPQHPQHPQQYQRYQYSQQQASPAPKPAPPVNLLDDSLEVTLPSQQGNQASLPVPPVPPNPQKDALLTALSQALVSQTRQVVASNQAAVAPLRAQQQALQSAYSRLQAELGELQHLDAALASNEQILKGAMVEADRAMDDARRRQVPDVDDVLVAPTVVGQQLYTLAAEERGIADALFVLGRALDKGRITADVFVKQTRSLAREQFLKKALIKKIAKGMALDEYQMR